MSVLQLIGDEVRGWGRFLVTQWPDTPSGFLLRRWWHWRRRTGARELVMARGAVLDDPKHIEVGTRVQIGEDCRIVADGVDGLRVYIGSDTQFARGIYVRSSNHRMDDVTRLIIDQGHSSKRVAFQGRDYAVVIGDDSWIGANVIIVSGAHIGKGAVVGAGSVVTGTIPDYAIAAGVPARVIGDRRRPKTTSPDAMRDNHS